MWCNTLFGQNERGEYLDFYCRHRHAGDQHWRLFEDGGMQELELPTSWRTSSDDPAEDARLQEAFYAENTRIYGLLRDKGFEGNLCKSQPRWCVERY